MNSSLNEATELNCTCIFWNFSKTGYFYSSLYSINSDHVGTFHDGSMSTTHILLSAHIKAPVAPFCYRGINVHQQQNTHSSLFCYLLLELIEQTFFPPKKVGLNPNTNSHHMRPWDASGVSTLILRVSKYAKFSWHLNEKLPSSARSASRPEYKTASDAEGKAWAPYLLHFQM